MHAKGRVSLRASGLYTFSWRRLQLPPLVLGLRYRKSKIDEQSREHWLVIVEWTIISLRPTKQTIFLPKWTPRFSALHRCRIRRQLRMPKLFGTRRCTAILYLMNMSLREYSSVSPNLLDTAWAHKRARKNSTVHGVARQATFLTNLQYRLRSSSMFHNFNKLNNGCEISNDCRTFQN